MENKKYIDKVLDHHVRGTRIDYEKERIYFPFFSYLPLTQLSSLLSPHSFPPPPFSTYCRNQFGLTEEEIDYVWNEYITTIKDKISKRES